MLLYVQACFSHTVTMLYNVGMYTPVRVTLVLVQTCNDNY